MVKKVEKWVARDGLLFNSEADAVAAEVHDELATAMRPGERWRDDDTTLYARWLIEHSDFVIGLLSRLHAQKAPE